MHLLKTTALLCSIMVIGACGSTNSASNQQASTPDTTISPDTTAPDGAVPAELVGRTWTVDSFLTVGGLQPVPAGSVATLVFGADSRVAIDTGCNTGWAAVAYTGGTQLTVGAVALTKKACSDELGALEASVLGNLQFIVNWSVDGSRLTLMPINVTDSGMQLTSAPVDIPSTVPDTTEPPTTEPTTTEPRTTVPDTSPLDTEPGGDLQDRSRLIGPTWIAQQFITVGPLDVVPAGVTASLTFVDDGHLQVDTGCNHGSADITFRADGGFDVGPLTLTQMACVGDNDAVEQRITGLLALPMQWSVVDDQLTIYPITVTDTGLILADAATITTETPTTVSAADQLVIDRANLLATAARTRVTTDNSFGGQSAFTEIAIVETLGHADPATAMVITADGDVEVTGTERNVIEVALAPATVRWIASAKDPVAIAAQQAGQLSGILSMSDPVIDGGTASIVTGVYCGSTCGTGGTYTLTRGDDGWSVTDRPGVSWIS